MIPRQPDELQPASTCESLAELMARQTLRVEQAVDVATDIAKQVASLHRRGLAFGLLESRNIRISGGRASLALLEPAVGARAADDVRDFAVWLRGLVRALPQESPDRRRTALHEIAGRYLQPESPLASTQMKKAAMALSLLRVTSHSMAAPEAALVSVSATVAPVAAVAPVAPITPAAPVALAKNPGKGRVLLLVRVVPGPRGIETTDAKIEAPSRNLPWYAAAIVVTCFVGALFYFMRRIL